MADKMCELCALYALGGLDDAERLAFEEHLATCADCQAELAQMTPIADALLYDFEELEPPQELRQRVLAAAFAEERTETAAPTAPMGVPVRHEDAGETLTEAPSATPSQEPRVEAWSARRERRRMRTWWVAPWAALVLVAAGLGWSLHRVTPSETIGEVKTQVQLAPTAGMGSAKMWVISSPQGQEMLIRFHGLKRPVGSQVYQVWVIRNGQPPQSAGVFVPDAQGNAVFASLMPNEPVNIVAVTLEPKAIDVRPLGTMVFKAQLST
ncbi:anti-sigma factor [Alicyclobacillus vulcanalis]|uniref:Anti-sigma-W factor RsiW n=1 Tax=Alicyclobacillus vulcanalis TaxID=252246 RepID=A0A1N7PNS5_9BACL|nr:anti-sigma factor [Alicyclobacillus vulcanalis]SIT12246.1 Putative zinc-finger [Alicyclobacillus vulcanalis]